ncbi:MAG: hypothetical protein H6696_12955 [Deferribacteres bacterium]|nr:hypothetical protein [Deferribacteres bacterium]
MAEKFNPTMVTANTMNSIAPEPVEIMNQDLYQRRWPYPACGEGMVIGSYFFRNTQGWNYSGIESPPVIYQDAAGNLYCVAYHFEWAGLSGNSPSDWKTAYSTERSHNNFAHTYYAHLFKDGSYYAIQYWFFYPYNDGNNNHEGDWEHINVFVSSQDPNAAYIIKVEYYFHHRYLFRVPQDLIFENGTHPYVYIGGDPGVGENTGGSYPEPGEWPNTWNMIDEHVEGVGPVIHYTSFYNASPNRGLVILKDRDQYDYNQNPEMSWLNAKIAWGHMNVSSPSDWHPWDGGGNAPGSPAYNPGWNRTGSCDGNFELYIFSPQ